MQVVRAAGKGHILEAVEETERLVDCVHTGCGLVACPNWDGALNAHKK